MSKLRTQSSKMQEKLDQLAAEVANVSGTVKTILVAIQGDAALGQAGMVPRITAVELKAIALEAKLQTDSENRAYRRGMEKTVTIIISVSISAVIAFVAAWIGAHH